MAPEDATYATAEKTYRKGKVAAVDRKLVHGTDEGLFGALTTSACSGKINTAFLKRQNGTDRCHNARKARGTHEFSKDLRVHVAIGWWVMFCYNFHHQNRGLWPRLADGSYLHRTPAMAMGLEDNPLKVAEFLTTQIVGFMSPHRFIPAHLRQHYLSGIAL